MRMPIGRTVARSLLLGLGAAFLGFAIPCVSVAAAPSTPVTALVLNAQRWVPTGDLNVVRSGHTATLLTNGKVLVVAGDNSNGTNISTAISTAELFDPATGTWTMAGQLNANHVFHTATLLRDGRVLVVGGVNENGHAVVNSPYSAELYDPNTGTWRAASPTTNYLGHTATMLQSGKVLIADSGGGVGPNLDALYDPALDSWGVTGLRPGIRRFGLEATLLQDGRVLLTGGAIAGTHPVATATVDLYDPGTNSWQSTLPLNHARYGHTATLLADGKVLVAAGHTSSEGEGFAARVAELYDPTTGTWSDTGSIVAQREFDETASLLPDGSVLLVGGFYADGSEPTDPSAEVYDRKTEKWVAAARTAFDRSSHTATRLLDGRILVAGGYGAAGRTAEIYTNLALASNSFRITSLFSDQAGLYQMIQLTELSGLNDQQRFTGLTLTSTSRSGVVKVFVFPNDLPGSYTAYRSALIKSASLSLPPGYFDYVVPDGFLPTEAGGSVGIDDPTGRPGDQFAAADVGAGPFDGHSAFLTSGGVDAYGLFQSFGSPVFHVTTEVDPVIEYYNFYRDHFFMTASQPDIDALDSGRIPGFIRTGESFPAWISAYVDPFGATRSGPPLGLQPVCRYYIPPVDGDSHFFSVSANECAVAKTMFPEYVLETTSSFLATIPNPQTGVCPADQTPVYRLWNGRRDSNHRYTTSTAIRDQMIARGYVAEGSGPNSVAMCVGGHN